ncbi:MAG TPA: hypothetical protein VH394_30960 [Thermoanaerobaculia bacterium]|nr:hypothetical protein [Thermoanaerobaculia bacterium]
MNPRPKDRELWLFAALIVLHLLPIWMLPVAPTQDGPAHLSMAHALRQIDRPGGGYLREYLQPNREAIPNWFVFFLLADALRPFSLPVAEKILLSAYVILLPLSARYALRAVRPGSGFLAFLVFPFIYNYLLNMGFYNFCFSLAAFLFALGFWLKRRGRLGPLRAAGLALLVLWAYFCHPVTLGVLVGTLLTLAGWRALLRHRFADLIWTVAACIPAVLLLLTFLSHRMGGRVSDMTVWAKTRQLVSLYSLVSIDSRMLYLALVLSILLGLLTAITLVRRGKVRRLLPGDGLLVGAVLLVGVYYLAPNEMGQGGFVTHRLNLFPFLVLILWFGTFSYAAPIKAALRSAASALALGFLAATLALWAGLDAYLGEVLTAAPHLEPRKTLVTLSFSNAGVDEIGEQLSFRTWPFVHAGSLLAARRPVVDLSLYEAHEDYFPLTYRPEKDPFTRLAREPLDLEAEPPRVDLSALPIDYVLLVWPKAVPPENSAAQSIRRQLAGRYERIHVSPEGIAELYRRIRP